MNYCILGKDGVQGGYVVEMRIVMEEWCKDNCRGRYAVLDHGEIKFEDPDDAKRFGKAWFMPANWNLRKMHPDCKPHFCASRDYQCPRSEKLAAE